MQRNETENFRDYQARREAANLAVKNLNRPERVTDPLILKQMQNAGRYRPSFSTGIRGIKSSNFTANGAGIAAVQARRNLTPKRIAAHKAHLAHMENRRHARLAAQHGL